MEAAHPLPRSLEVLCGEVEGARLVILKGGKEGVESVHLKFRGRRGCRPSWYMSFLLLLLRSDDGGESKWLIHCIIAQEL